LSDANSLLDEGGPGCRCTSHVTGGSLNHLLLVGAFPVLNLDDTAGDAAVPITAECQ
jgi:hypothetical protein